MKRSVSSVNKDGKTEDLNIIFDRMPDVDDRNTLISNFVHWQPLYDLYVVDDEVVITLEIAGVPAKDFSIFVNKEHMVIDGIRKSPVMLTRNCCTFHNIEIPYGRFNIRIDFPVPVEPRKYHYAINNGILTIKFGVVKEKIIPIEDG